MKMERERKAGWLRFWWELSIPYTELYHVVVERRTRLSLCGAEAISWL